MKFRRQMGLTLMEVLVAVTVIMVIAAITFVGLRAWRDHSLQAACMQKLSRINEALMAYRAEWGNPHEVVGSAAYLGLPLEEVYVPPGLPRSARFIADVENLVRFGKTREERREAFTCPRRPFGEPVDYRWWHIMQFADEEEGKFPYSSATNVLKGETPVLDCRAHNAPNVELEERSERYLLIILALDGSVRREHVTGLFILFGSGGPELLEEDRIEYIRLRDPEGFDREMRLLQERRQRRR
jgi:hypothetical protein